MIANESKDKRQHDTETSVNIALDSSFFLILLDISHKNI